MQGGRESDVSALHVGMLKVLQPASNLADLSETRRVSARVVCERKPSNCSKSLSALASGSPPSHETVAPAVA